MMMMVVLMIVKEDKRACPGQPNSDQLRLMRCSNPKTVIIFMFAEIGGSDDGGGSGGGGGGVERTTAARNDDENEAKRATKIGNWVRIRRKVENRQMKAAKRATGDN